MFDYIFITHLPAFYKVNLYNELSKNLKICVIFVGKGSNIRTPDFVANEINFEYHFLSDGEFESRNVMKCLFKLILILSKTKSKKIVVGGWNLVEFWFAVLLNKRNGNALALESSYKESSIVGIRKIIKQLFLSRITTVFASGVYQKELLNKLNYKDTVYITKGVGIINKSGLIKSNSIFNNKFLYIGRLSTEKNLFMLIRVFNQLPHFTLTIVGSGKLEQELKAIAKQNIHFVSHIKNCEISKIYSDNSVFILPSTSEPWGLVIEEALYYRLPVIISDQIGCGQELIHEGQNGLVFDATSDESLKNAVIMMAENYSDYLKNVMQFDINSKDEWQINCYSNAVKKFL